MIGKIVKGRSFKGCVSYVLGNKDAKLLCSEGVLETDTASIINSFYMQSLMNPDLSKSVGHIPLSFSLEDAPRMTDQFIERLAKEYMKAMGIENTQYMLPGILIPPIHIVISYSTGWTMMARLFPTRTTVTGTRKFVKSLRINTT